MSNENPAAEPTREQHENKIKVFQNFLTALGSGTFSGAQCIHIAALGNLLQQEYAQAVKDYEAAAATRPEWGRPAANLTPAAYA